MDIFIFLSEKQAKTKNGNALKTVFFDNLSQWGKKFFPNPSEVLLSRPKI